MLMSKYFIDLFSGCGGLSEGFIQAGFNPLAHIEMDKAACFSIKTRLAFHYLKKNNKLNIYKDYLLGLITREELYSYIPQALLNSVINQTISQKTLLDIFLLVDKQIAHKKVDVLVGGPPCQAYSLVGRARSVDGMKNDKRNWLFKFYIQFLNKYTPTCFIFENVLGLLSAKDSSGNKYIDIILGEFKDAGYDVSVNIISAERYGVPQNRKRVIIIGAKKGKCSSLYLKLSPNNVRVPIKGLLEDLPPVRSGNKSNKYIILKKPNKLLEELSIADNLPITLHKARPNNKRDLEIYKLVVEKWNRSKERLHYGDLPLNLQTHKNKNAFIDRFKVVAWDLPYSQTVVAHLSKDGHYYIHPDITQNSSLTPREAARLQTFPDSYYFESAVAGKECLSSIFRQIGNAVPVYLAKQIADNIKKDILHECK